MDKENTTQRDNADLQETAAFDTGMDTVGDVPDVALVGSEFGRYKVEGVLGEGAMGFVYRAHDTQLDRDIALKIPKFTKQTSDKMIRRFYREARAAATLSHPTICQVYDVGDIGGVHYIAMALIKGHPLSDYIGPERNIDPRSAALIIRKVAVALQEAHGAGIVHRDVKPANIMIDHRKEPVVMDFGLAVQEHSLKDSRLTQAGALLGSPAYMSKEQLEGNVEKIGPLTDIYALGVVFYELLTGDLPFKGSGSVMTMIGEILTKDVPDPRSVRSDLPSKWAKICMKAMAKEPENRYQSMSKLSAAIAEAMQAQAVSSASIAATSQLRMEIFNEQGRTVKSLCKEGQYIAAKAILEKMAMTKGIEPKYIERIKKDLVKIDVIIEKQQAKSSEQESIGTDSWFDDDSFGASVPAQGVAAPLAAPASATTPAAFAPVSPAAATATPQFASPHSRPTKSKRKKDSSNLKLYAVFGGGMLSTLLIVGVLIWWIFGEHLQADTGTSESASPPIATEPATE